MAAQPRDKKGRFAHAPSTAELPKASPELPQKSSMARWELTLQVRSKDDGRIVTEEPVGPFVTRIELEGALLKEVNKHFGASSRSYVTGWVSHPFYGQHMADPMGFHAALVSRQHPENLSN